MVFSFSLVSHLKIRHAYNQLKRLCRSLGPSPDDLICRENRRSVDLSKGVGVINQSASAMRERSYREALAGRHDSGKNAITDEFGQIFRDETACDCRGPLPFGQDFAIISRRVRAGRKIPTRMGQRGNS
ncbi:MAG: hypothetical protein KGK00_08325 [Paracoccaceae bacterium]|nr:hypothetical protein [Paracoccaceae bacterium]